MNSKVLMLGAACAFAISIFMLKNKAYFNAPKDCGNATKAFRIAVLTPTEHPSLQQIENGFCKTLNRSETAKYDVSVFNANGNKILLRAQAEEIINQGFDLIFTIGAGATKLCNELCIKKGKNIPVVFGAVARPDKLGLVKSAQNPGGLVTGTIEKADYDTQLNLLLKLKPETKSILLIYNPTQGAGLEEDKNEVAQILAKKGIMLIPCEVYNINEIQGKLASLIQNVDVVFILKDHTVVAAADAIIKQCNLHHKILLSTDLETGHKGAALSFGVSESKFGEQGAYLAQQILENGISPAQLACVTDYNNKLQINTKTMGVQGLTIPENMMQLFKYAKTI